MKSAKIGVKQAKSVKPMTAGKAKGSGRLMSKKRLSK